MQLYSLLLNLASSNKKITILFVIYLILQVQGFTWALGHEFLYFLVKCSVGLSILLLLSILVIQNKYKLLLVIGYFALLVGINRLHLGNISARTYLHSKRPFFDEATSLLKTKKSVFISKARIQKADKFNLNLSVNEKQTLLDLFDNTSVIEIDVSNGNILFTFDRFIDNGYGFLYVNDPKILKGVRPTVIYDLTIWLELSENWYSVAFT